MTAAALELEEGQGAEEKENLPAQGQAEAAASGAQKPAAPEQGAGGARVAQVAAAVLRRAPSRAEGEELFKRLRSEDSRKALDELGLPAAAPVTSTELVEVQRRCDSHWQKALERDAEHIFRYVLEECSSMMDADKRFRSLQAKVGRRLHGRGVLTEEVLDGARERCQQYWAKVTPGNVATIVNNICGKCPNWESADRKFDWLWKKGEWEMERRCVTLAGRTFSAEDLEQAERRCRKGFGLPGTAQVRTPGTGRVGQAAAGGPAEAPAEAAAAPAAASAPAKPAEDPQPSKPEAAAQAPAARPAAAPEPAPAPKLPLREPEAAGPAKPLEKMTNAEFIVQHILKKCSTAEAAAKFFKWLHQDKGATRVKGRVFAAEDVEEAERRCRKVWEAADNNSASSSSSSGSSDSEDSDAPKAPKAPKAPEAATPRKEQQAKNLRPSPSPVKKNDSDEQADKVQKVVDYCMEKYKKLAKAEKFFEKLHATVGAKNSLGLVLSEEEVTEAWLMCTAYYEEKATEKAMAKAVEEAVELEAEQLAEKAEAEALAEQREFEKAARREAREAKERRKAEAEAAKKAAKEEERTKRAASFDDLIGSSKKDLNNVDMIVRHIIRKCEDVNKAEKFFDMLHGSVGQVNKLGRVFSEEDVTEAWLRCTAFFEEQAAQAEEEGSSGSSSGSSSSSGPTRRPRRKGKDGAQKEKKKRGKKGKLKKSRTFVEEELEGALFGSDSDELSGEEELDAEDERGLSADLLADLEKEGEEPAVLDDGYPAKEWKQAFPDRLPGFAGFNERATNVMQTAMVGQAKMHVEFDQQAACPPLQPHQESVAFLMHPQSPIQRMLVDHPTGSGKTREMIRVLDNFFHDNRPKVPIFPKDPVCRNFYVELLRWPSRYRDYFCCERPADAGIACGKGDWKDRRHHMWDLSNFTEEEIRRLSYSIREVLEMKNFFYMGRVRRSYRVTFMKKHPGELMPRAPLRAIGYTSAGGSYSTMGESGRPNSAIMKIGFEKGSTNVYSNKVVLMDEAHNLVRTQTQYGEQLERLRALLYGAKNLVLAGFTGTPILNEPSEGRQLLDIIKGVSAPEGDEGFLSSFPMRPQPLFPVSLPRGLPDGVLTLARKKQLVRKIEMHGETLKIYDIKRRLGLPARRLRAYCNVCTFHSNFHDGRHGSKIKILTFPEDCCPKLFAIAQAVAASPEKAIIMTGRMSGHIVMLELMRFVASKADPPFGVATMDQLSEFNHCSNLHGEVYRVLVADALQCSEGVSFLAVRRTFLSDVPVSPSSFIQQCGRAIRMYGHRGLPDDQQVVTTTLYVATLPKWMRTSSLACWALRAQKRHTSGKEVEKRARLLTARLNRAGIKTLADLKTRIDGHGASKQQSLPPEELVEGAGPSKVLLSTDDVVVFLEQNGLWDEARLLRNAEKKEREKEKAVEEAKQDLARSIEAGQRMPTAGRSLSRMDSMDLDDADNSQGNPLGEDDDFEKALESVLDAAGVQGMPEVDTQLSQDGNGAKGQSIEEAVEEALASITGPGFEETMQQSLSMDKMDVDDGKQAPAPVLDGAPAPAAGAAAEAAAGGGAASTNGTNGSAQDGASKAPEIPDDIAVSRANGVMRLICKEMDRSTSTKSFGPEAPSTEAQPPAETPMWKAQLADGLRELRHSGPVAAALRNAVHPGFSTEDGDLTELTAEQAKALRAELLKLEKVATLKKALSVVREAVDMISRNASTLSRTTSAAAGVAGAPQPSEAPTAEAPAPAAPDATGDAQSAPAAEAPAAGDAQAAPAAEAPAAGEAQAAPAAEAPTAGDAQAAPAAEASAAAPGEEAAAGAKPAAAEEGANKNGDVWQAHLQEAAERTWRAHLAENLRDLRRSEHVTAALKVTAPALLETSDDALTGLTADQVRRLHDELLRLQEEAEKGGNKPRALVRAMQTLYMADSVEDANLTLSVETADEEALRQLTERTEEFAPALAALRELAVDREIFEHLKDKCDEDGVEGQESESEGSDVAKELINSKEPAPVVLPAGWRLEWVKRKKKEVKEFVDPAGQRYYSVKDVRVAIARWEAQAAAAAARAAAADAPPTKRMRLRSKISEEGIRLWQETGQQPESQPEAAEAEEAADEPFDLEAAFEEELADALMGFGGESQGKSAPSKSSARAAPPKARPPAPAVAVVEEQEEEAPGEPRPGARITLKGLVAKPELNGLGGVLGDFSEETGRWECELDDGSTVNVKPANFDIMPARPKRAAASGDAVRRVRAKSKTSEFDLAAAAPAAAPPKAGRAAGKAKQAPPKSSAAPAGRGGRGRGAVAPKRQLSSKAPAPAEEDDSD